MTTPSRRAQKTALKHPDFELYDNVSSTAEPIHTSRTRSATKGDRYRGVNRRAEAFRTRHPMPVHALAAPDLSPCHAALDAAMTPTK
ncbi:hypothetical protein ACIP2Y_38830 [Streptomyces sviceus]|uniref:hypothetical protein n=1 Tax=Streptomyces sviceus TaxID=285530 RepID=UPI0038175F32